MIKQKTKNSIFYHRHTFDIYQIHRFIMKEVRLRYFESGVGCFLTLLFFFGKGNEKTVSAGCCSAHFLREFLDVPVNLFTFL